MVIAHNMLSANANRQLGIVTENRKKTTEKLSSGYRINRAADDAAGLQISEKMRSQIRGLTQASSNCQDGVSLCQVADGALTETHSILQRINELCVKSANGTNTDADRAAIQSEVEQLTEEFDRIATSTSFNAEIYPLKGQVLNRNICEITVGCLLSAGGTVNGVTYNPGDIVELTGLTLPGSGSQMVITKSGHKFVYDKDAYPQVELDSNRVIENLYMDDLVKSEGNVMSFTDIDGNKRYLQCNPSGVMFAPTTSPKSNGVCLIADEVFIQAGAHNKEEQRIPINFVDATKSGLKLDHPAIDVSTQDGALSAIGRISNAIDTVSGYRSYYGATQNRMEHTIANLDNIVENTQKAESQIRDTNMAKEMVEFSKQNVLVQAGTSMLSSANQSAQSVLSLLQ